MSIPINVKDLLNKRKIESNRRLGDYLQELQLSEGRATGIPTIQDEIPCRDGFENEMDAKNGTINERETALIAEIAKQPGIKKNELAEKMDLS